MIKKLIYHGLFILNVTALLLAIVNTYLIVGKAYSTDDLYKLTQFRLYVTLFVLGFLIWNIVIWSKHDRKVSRFLALLFLPGFYTLFYYFKVLNNKWI